MSHPHTYSVKAVIVGSLMVAIAVFAFFRHQYHTTANSVLVETDKIIITYPSKRISIDCKDLQKIHLACYGKGSGSCGITLYVYGNKKHATKGFTTTDNAKALRHSIQSTCL